jgi:crooked neck
VRLVLRSVYERALDVDHRNIGLWLKYTEMEMRNKQVNHARNLWDRAVTILPRANQFWYKYTYMEEMLNNIAGLVSLIHRQKISAA